MEEANAIVPLSSGSVASRSRNSPGVWGADHSLGDELFEARELLQRVS